MNIDNTFLNNLKNKVPCCEYEGYLCFINTPYVDFLIKRYCNRLVLNAFVSVVSPKNDDFKHICEQIMETEVLSDDDKVFFFMNIDELCYAINSYTTNCFITLFCSIKEINDIIINRICTNEYILGKDMLLIIENLYAKTPTDKYLIYLAKLITCSPKGRIRKYDKCRQIIKLFTDIISKKYIYIDDGIKMRLFSNIIYDILHMVNKNDDLLAMIDFINLLDQNVQVKKRDEFIKMLFEHILSLSFRYCCLNCHFVITKEKEQLVNRILALIRKFNCDYSIKMHTKSLILFIKFLHFLNLHKVNFDFDDWIMEALCWRGIMCQTKFVHDNQIAATLNLIFLDKK